MNSSNPNHTSSVDKKVTPTPETVDLKPQDPYRFNPPKLPNYKPGMPYQPPASRYPPRSEQVEIEGNKELPGCYPQQWPYRLPSAPSLGPLPSRTQDHHQRKSDSSDIYKPH